MSFDVAQICCTGCDYETWEHHQPICLVYRLNDGKHVNGGISAGWCFNCDEYGDTENLDLDWMRQLLAATEREQSEYQARLDDLLKGTLRRLWSRSERRQTESKIERLNSEIGDIRLLFDIAKKRAGRARCLRCWSDHTTPLSFNAIDGLAHNFTHRCGGTLKVIHEEKDALRVSFSVATYFLNADGQLLEGC